MSPVACPKSPVYTQIDPCSLSNRALLTRAALWCCERACMCANAGCRARAPGRVDEPGFRRKRVLSIRKQSPSIRKRAPSDTQTEPLYTQKSPFYTQTEPLYTQKSPFYTQTEPRFPAPHFTLTLKRARVSPNEPLDPCLADICQGALGSAKESLADMSQHRSTPSANIPPQARQLCVRVYEGI